MTTPPPLDPQQPAPPDQQCDLVLTGGVSSGVVYPWAILELARVYRFRGIGGSSVGALAAAITAAAEYRRRQSGSTAGFELLRQMPAALAEPRAGMTTLLSLFQPLPGARQGLWLQPCTARLFRLFLSALRPHAAIRLPLSFLRAYALAAWPGLGLCLVFYLLAAPLFGDPGPLYGLLGYALAALASMLCFCWRDLTQGVVGNGYGLCTGATLSADAQARPGLTEWLHQGIQAAAGRSATEAPLCFDELRGQPGEPLSIDLQVFSTNLSHGRPYKLPEADSSSRLFFKPEELARYFPAAVIEHLRHKARPYQAQGPSDPPSADPDILELPSAELPLVVAARLSLSFPLLFSAVPLWAIDYEAPVGQRRLERCWFSDGGLCSNFPIHLFDAWLPSRPTFGIFLGQRSKYWKRQPVWLPPRHNQGRGDSWDRFAEAPTAARGMLGYLLALLGSAKDWKDHSLMRMPGVRDRVVRIGFEPGEGALNIAMSGSSIMDLAARYGTPAGLELRRRFAPTAAGPARGWSEHRWVRLMALIQALGDSVRGLARAVDDSPQSAPLREQIAAAFLQRPLDGDHAEETPLQAGQADAIDEMLTMLLDLERRCGQAAAVAPYTAEPRPVMQVRSPL